MRRTGARSGARALAALLVTAATALAGAADAFADVTVDARVGHGGRWVADAATPVDVLLRNDGPDVVSTALTVKLSGFGAAGFEVTREVALGGNTTRLETFLVPGPNSWQPEIALAVETSPRVPVHSQTKTGDRGQLEIDLAGLQRRAQSLQPDQFWPIGVLGDPRSVLSARLGGVPCRPERQVLGSEPVFGLVDVALESLRLAPLSLDGIDTLVACDPDATFCDTEADLEGVLDWVALGGTLVVSLGENAASFAASPLAARFPVRWSGAARADYTALVTEMTGATEPVKGVLHGPAVRLDATDGDDELRSRMRTVRFGDGRLVLLGFDLRTAYESLPDDKVARRRAGSAIFGEPPDPWGRDEAPWQQEADVATCVGYALQAEAFQPPPLLAVLLALVAYVLVVGPLDWIVLKRLRKERYTTFTFAGAVLLFTVVAYGVSLLLFASDAVTNRITFVRLASGGRDGRELVSIQDVAGFYAPTGGTHEMKLPLPGTVLGGNLPGLPAAGGVGASRAVEVDGTEVLGPVATIEVAFRSQRVVRSRMIGPTGRTLAVEPLPPEPEPGKPGSGDPGAQDRGGVAVTSTLAVDLVDSWVFRGDGVVAHVGAVPAGGTRRGRWRPYGPQVTASAGSVPDVTQLDQQPRPEQVRDYLAHLAVAPMLSVTRPAGYEALRRAGIIADRPKPGRALVVGVAERSPVPLPGEDGPGRSHVVIVKEVPLP